MIYRCNNNTSSPLLVAAVVLLASAVAVTSIEAANPRQAKQLANCANITEVLEKCGAQSSFSHTMRQSAYPTTINELKEVCPRNIEGLKCLRQHLKCLKTLTKRAMFAFIEGRRKHVRGLCDDLNGQQARDFVDLFACIKKHKRDKFVQSEMVAIKRIDALMSDQVKEFRERFQRTCCAINTYKHQSFEDLGAQCNKPNFRVALEAAIDSVVGEAVEFACPENRASICLQYKELQLSKLPVNKTLTRAGSELLLMLTEPDEAELTANPKFKDKVKEDQMSS